MDTKHEAHEFLKQHKLGVLSTVSKEAEPWGAAIYYSVDSSFNFYFLTRSKTQKYSNVTDTAHAALTVVDDYQQTTVQMLGTVTEVPIGEEHDIAFRKLAGIHPPGQFSWITPESKMHQAGASTLMKLTPKYMRYSCFKPDPAHSEGYIAEVNVAE